MLIPVSMQLIVSFNLSRTNKAIAIPKRTIKVNWHYWSISKTIQVSEKVVIGKKFEVREDLAFHTS